VLGWAVVGVLAVSLLVLWWVTASLVGRLRPLRRARRRLVIRVEQARRIQVRAEALQVRLVRLRAAVADVVVDVQDAVDDVRRNRGDSDRA
jgi:hypothetical protein